ncbi:MAG: hypothetical protein ACFFB3_13270 [Candidatus Hodarchaeota archaeon]
MPGTQYECLVLLNDGSTEEASLTSISDHEKAFLIQTSSKIYVLPTASVRMSAIAQRAARNMRLANALRHEIEMVGIGERDSLKSELASGTPVPKRAPPRPVEAVQESSPISFHTQIQEEESGRVMRAVAAREEVSEVPKASDAQKRVPELITTTITDEDYLIRIFGAHLLGTPLKNIQNLLSSAYYSEAQKTVFENKMRRLMEQFIQNIG